ncbi:helix-turn-helix domain-containing protein [Paenibacillus alvei]|uniref:helix-turn-helix domain-containing protein n=1 Tax=Paenibacillus alvei TaxID=44250 RepID=UPI00227DC1EB|nr:helix-turn-helix domain-containing protein [Paenibacillus alvei]MCY9737939.1 helix-turn-helix domain-containing protein [Paenibacillus alvei]
MTELLDLPDILTASDIAKYLKLSRRRVYELFDLSPEMGGIPNFNIGLSRRVRKEDLMEWIGEQLKKGGKSA